MSPARPRPARWLLLLVALLAAAPALPAATGDGKPAPAGDGKPAPSHTHTWQKKSRKEWVPPEKQRVRVGTDAKGNPIYETKIVKPGWWKTVNWLECSCGATRPS